MERVMAAELNIPIHSYYQRNLNVRLPRWSESRTWIDVTGAKLPDVGGSGGGQSIFGSAAPAMMAAADGNGYTIGTVFTVSVPGTVTHVRVYRNPALVTPNCPIAVYANNNPVSVANDVAAVFIGAGWNDIPLPTPLAVTTGVQYMAAYFNGTGAYAYTTHRFDSAVTNGNLTALSDASAGGNGKFRQDSAFGIPSTSFNATWYGVDVVFV
jgi:hypothetical protein